MKIQITEQDAANVAQLMEDERFASVGRVIEELREATGNQFSDPAAAADHGGLAWKAGVLGGLVMIEDRLAQLREEHLERVCEAARQNHEEAKP